MPALDVAPGVVGLLITVIAWQFLRNPRKPPPTVAGDVALVVEAANRMPVYDLPDGSQTPGEWLVGVTLYNRGDRRVCVSSWGVRVPDGSNIVALAPVTSFEPRLPHWVEPGTNGTWYLQTDEVRRIAAERGLAFGDMRPWVSLADGRRVEAPAGIPLK